MSQPSSARGPLQVLGACLLGLVAAVLAVWATVHSLGLATTDGARVWLPPTPRGELALAEQQFAAKQRVDPAERTAIERLAIRTPLAHEPFAWTGYTALIDGDTERGERLLLEAKDRRPRSRLARMALMQTYATRGDLDALAGELVPLLRLERDLIAPLTEQWVKAARTPKDVAVLAQVLSADPATFANVAEMAARSRMSPALTAAFLEYDPRTGLEGTTRLERQLLLSLVEQGEFDAAYAAWLKRAGGARAPAGELYNGDFTDRQSPPPFNWDLAGGRDGVAEYHREGGVFADYFGRGNSPFLRQLVRLSPGRYRLAVTMTGETGSGGGLAWVIRCAGINGATLLDRPVANPAGTLAVEFGIPPGCNAQWLVLESRGALRQGEGQRLIVNRVELSPAGAAS